MLNIHLRGQEVPACNAGECLRMLFCLNRVSNLQIDPEALHILLLQMKQMMHTVW